MICMTCLENDFLSSAEKLRNTVPFVKLTSFSFGVVFAFKIHILSFLAQFIDF